MTKKYRLYSSQQQALRTKILRVMKEQGFEVNPHIKPPTSSKDDYRRIQSISRLEQIHSHRKFLQDFSEDARSFSRNGEDIEPSRIKLELREVKENSLDEKIFRWWNLIWWSIPYAHPYGRQMRFLIWDSTHNSPFGLLTLQSPILHSPVRDKALGIPNDELDSWVNKSMHAQRVRALPPYNELIGGKMVALAMTSNEVREAYRKKYCTTVSILKKRKLEPDLLFITTTSAFGKSTIYDRLKYNGEIVAKSLGYTKGAGTFHIPETLYNDILEFLASFGVDVSKGYGHGPSRKLKLIRRGLEALGLKSFIYHGLKREFYLFPLVHNLEGVIQTREKPIWLNREFWKKRWALHRSETMPFWKDFRVQKFFKGVWREISDDLTIEDFLG